MKFGISLAPVAKDLGTIRELAQVGDDEGLELLGIQDHPYVAGFVDTFALIGTVLAETTRISVFPDVASLPLRGPAMLAKAAASLDLLSDGRFELGLGAGGFMKAIVAMGGPNYTTGEARRALEEGIEIIREMWRPGHTVRRGPINGVHAGPAPAHDIGIWLGSVGPRALELTGRVADGWAAPIPHYLPYEKWAAANRMIDEAATAAGRDPRRVTRIAQLVGDITADASPPRLAGEEPIRADARRWAEVIAGLHDDGFDTFVYWPENPDHTQVLRWIREVAPAARALR